MARVHPSEPLAAYVALLLMIEAGWLVTSHRVPEGVVLVAITANHGVTAVDLVGVALVMLAVALFSQAVVRRRRAG